MIRKQTGLLEKWVPMPRYLLRRFVVRDLIRQLDPRDFIEVGAGSGELAKWLHDRGTSGIVTEISPLAIQMLHERLGDTDVRIHAGDLDSLQGQTDLLVCMEVLEHVEDDDAMLRQFHRLLRPGGHLIISVPAHQKRFADDDHVAGHLRRYERAELSEQLQANGFAGPKVLCYGFPLGLLLRHLRIRKARTQLQSDRRTAAERTQASGVERDCQWLRCVLNDVCFFPFHVMQMPFLRMDWAEGYVVIAQKPIV